MSAAPPSPSKKRFSRQGFQPLTTQHLDGTMAPNDATIDIPLEEVPSNSYGLRSQTSTSYLRPTQTQDSAGKEKRSYFRGRRVKEPRQQGGQRTGRVGYDGEEDTINTMGKIYTKVLNFSLVTRYFLYVLPLALCIAAPIIVGATAAKNAKLAGVPIVWFFTWIEIVWLSLWVSKIVAHYLPFIFEVLAGVVSSGVRKYSMVISSLEIPLSLVGWSVTALATFIPLMTLNPDARAAVANGTNKDATTPTNWETIVQKILGAAVVASLIFLAEKFLIQLISISYHRKQFNARIKDSKRNLYLLGLLYEASRTLFPAYCPEFAEDDYLIADQLDISLGLGSKKNGHARSGSATPMRIIHDIGRYGDKLTSAFGNVAHEITGKEVFNPNSSHSIVVEALERKTSTEALARRIWMSFVLDGREALYPDDVVDVLGSNRKPEAEEAFAALDGDGNGDVSLDEMILAVSEFSRERKSIASSMHDVDQAINVLDRLLILVVFVAIVFVFVAFLNASFTTTLATTGTALLSLSFIFSVTCQEVLGSCIFLFVKHPYDIGDRVDIGATDQFVVEHISLLFTVFKRISGANVGRLTQIPNIVLNTLWIENVSRSKAMSEQMTIFIDFGTSFDDLQLLKTELQNFVLDKDNCRDFQPQVEVGVLGTSDQSKLELQVEIKHKSNWANETIRQARRSKFMCALVSALRAVPIYPPGGGADAQGSAANPSYSVSVPDEVAAKSRSAAAAAKEAKRMVPTKKDEGLSGANRGATGAAGMTTQDKAVLDDLTYRDPASDPSRDEDSRDDGSTLGERQSIDPQDIEEVKTMLRRESTKGKRKPNTEASYYGSPSVPTINEPGPLTYADYAHPSSTSYESQRPAGAYSTMPASYIPKLRNLPPGMQYQPGQGQAPTVQPQNTSETTQIHRNPTSGSSNPFRKRSESVDRKPLSPTGATATGTGAGNGSGEAFENMRPYSGV